MTDVFAIAPRFSWRGKEYPILTRSVDFAHESVEHKFQYRDNEIIEQLGAHNLVFRYTLAMREDIAKGPYRNLFSVGLGQLIRDCRNRDPGELVDPIYGLFICTPNSFADESDVNKRDGVDVKVEFRYAPAIDEDDSDVTAATTQSVKTDAGALDQEAAQGSWHQEPSPEPTTDPLSAIAGVAGQIDAQSNRMSAALDDVAYRCEKIEMLVDKAEDPKNYPIKRSARRVREAALRAKARAQDPLGHVVQVTTRFGQTVIDLAGSVGMTTLDLLRLNPQLVSQPTVASGTVVRVKR
jgi:hypothetical protein